MESYSIHFKLSAEKDLRHLPRDVVLRAMGKIEDLKSEPFPSQSIRISGSIRLHRLRVGDYRIIYGVDQSAKQVTVHYIRHRREVYRRM